MCHQLSLVPKELNQHQRPNERPRFNQHQIRTNCVICRPAGAMPRLLLGLQACMQGCPLHSKETRQARASRQTPPKRPGTGQSVLAARQPDPRSRTHQPAKHMSNKVPALGMSVVVGRKVTCFGVLGSRDVEHKRPSKAPAAWYPTKHLHTHGT